MLGGWKSLIIIFDIKNWFNDLGNLWFLRKNVFDISMRNIFLNSPLYLLLHM